MVAALLERSPLLVLGAAACAHGLGQAGQAVAAAKRASVALLADHAQVLPGEGKLHWHACRLPACSQAIAMAVKEIVTAAPQVHWLVLVFVAPVKVLLAVLMA
eukprot:CAMPEP_0172801016 /NCGR_PEP_ID=MMETSP1075-20121228/2921_1 /TAXON_ID=2916 /ORGANISM="Ceratium fusus, Strain PA161109" /LENGTH=102 /DNA_ID=CAMNT_0013638995 /DNA_START=308 /DNA_END=616 /DNA_ORIENTATION=+